MQMSKYSTLLFIHAYEVTGLNIVKILQYALLCTASVESIPQ